MQAADPHARPMVASPKDAESLANGLIQGMARLREILASETELLRAARLREAATLGDAKSAAAKAYVQGLETLRANAIALARWAPASVDRLRRAQAELTDALTVNMAVLATARSVSEGIVRSLAAEVEAPRTLNTYGVRRPNAGPRPSAAPLLVSKSL